MYCKDCGNKLSDSGLCLNCNQKNDSNNKLKLVVLIMLGIIIVLLSIVAILLVSGGKNKNISSRTIMIFMAGNNLESEHGIASSDLSSIDPKKINLNNTNILLYAGGTKYWYNDFINPKENAIFKLEKDGFKKIKTYGNKNLGDSETLVNFLNYSYDNYKTDAYDLIFWDHGLGALGSVEDENTSDFLTPVELKNAFSKTKFNSKNKLETVLFRTCLNANMEIASSLTDYSNYMIASEEVTIGAPEHSVLNFLNEINLSDTGVDYGVKFINSYKKQVSEIDSFNSTDSTYSIIDLNKLVDTEKKIDDFFGKINLTENYNSIARIRSTLHQYATETASIDSYDTIDLYELVDNMKIYDNASANSLLNSIKSTVVYNYSTNNSSNGISIYFPFNGENEVKDTHLKLYKSLNFSPNYYSFISNFNDMQNTPYSANFSLNFTDNEIKKENKKNEREFSMELTDEQAENFAYASYIIFMKMDDNYFSPIYMSSKGEAKYNESTKTITTDLTNDIIKLYDKEDKTEHYIPIDAIESSNKEKKYKSIVLTWVNDENSVIGMSSGRATIHLKLDKKGKPYITNIIDPDGVSLDAKKDLKLIDFYNFSYKILDENGNYTVNWESNKTQTGWEVHPEDLEFKKGSLDDSGEFYCVFYIKDIKNNTYYSKLINIKE